MLRTTLLTTLYVSLLAAQSALPVTLNGDIVNAPDDYVVELISTESHQSAARSFGRADGRFSVGPVAAGSYELRVSTDRGELLHTQYVEVQPAANSIQIRLRDSKAKERPVSGLVSVRDLTKERKSAMKLLLQATDFRTKSKPTEAIRKYEEAIARDPSFALPHHDLAVEYIALKRPSEARAHLLAAIELDPKLTSAYTNLSVADLALGDPIGAEVSADHALTLNASDPKAGYLKKICLFMQGKGRRPPPFSGAQEQTRDGERARSSFSSIK